MFAPRPLQTLVVLLTALFAACASRGPSKAGHGAPSTPVAANTQPVAASSARSSDAAVALLRREGVIAEGTVVLSTEWLENLSEWLVTLQHPTGARSWWFVDAAATHYQGGASGQ